MSADKKRLSLRLHKGYLLLGTKATGINFRGTTPLGRLLQPRGRS